MSVKGKAACRWCLGTGHRRIIGVYGVYFWGEEYETCRTCAGTGSSANPAPPAGGDECRGGDAGGAEAGEASGPAAAGGVG